MQANVAGYYKIVATDKDTNQERILADWFPNLITNNGLNRLNIGSNAIFQHCYVGSGNNTPLVTNSTLQNFIAAAYGSALTESVQPTPPYYGKAIRSYTFAPGVAVGNLSEVGTGYDAEGTDLFSRALITDANGDPITITVLENDFLTVFYELRLYPPSGVTTSTAVIAGVQTEITVEAIEVTDAGSWMNMYHQAHDSNICFSQTSYVIGFNPAGDHVETLHYTGSSVGTYTPNNFYRDGRLSFNLNQMNSATGIGSMHIFTWVGRYQVTFDPPIVKDNTRTLSLDYRVNWGRYTP